MSKHILDMIGDALPEHLPGRSDAWVSVTWWTDDPAVLVRLAAEHSFAELGPGEHVVWRDPTRRLIVHVTCLDDDDDGEDFPIRDPDPSVERAA